MYARFGKRGLAVASHFVPLKMHDTAISWSKTCAYRYRKLKLSRKLQSNGAIMGGVASTISILSI